jgi:ubiquinone/menaquinone biosynthesis C-methylase UbiE
VTRTDAYGITDKLDDETLQVLVDRLEARARHPPFMAMLTQYLDVMGIDSAERVLDVGCGAGVAARAIAHRPDFRGRVTAIDLSDFLVRAGRQFALSEGVAQRIEFLVGDTQQLDLPDRCFDAAIAHTLLSHVEQPLKVLQELHRVVKPGALIGIFDGDYASITFGHEDPAVGARFDAVVRNAIITNAMVMRQMPRLLKQAQLEVIAFFPHVIAEAGLRSTGARQYNRFAAYCRNQARLAKQRQTRGPMRCNAIRSKASFLAPATSTPTSCVARFDATRLGESRWLNLSRWLTLRLRTRQSILEK